MPKTKPPYPPQFRSRILELVRSGRKPSELAKEFDLSTQTIRSWSHQAALDAGERKDGLTTDEKAELTRLRREVRTLREERDILSKAAAWFAQEAAPTPKKRFDS